MTPSFFLTLCLGAVAGLTPLAVYLVALVALNRRPRPTVVSGVWEFVGMLAGMSGLLFCTGVVLAGAAADARLLTGGEAKRIPSHMPWIGTIWLSTMGLYLAGIVILVVRGLRCRRGTVSVYAADPETVEAVIGDALVAADQTGERRGFTWSIDGKPIVGVHHFAAFKHTQVHFSDRHSTLAAELERHLRVHMPQQPSAESPAAPWIGTALTWCLVVVGCCIVLIFAMPFLRG